VDCEGNAPLSSETDSTFLSTVWGETKSKKMKERVGHVVSKKAAVEDGLSEGSPRVGYLHGRSRRRVSRQGDKATYGGLASVAPQETSADEETRRGLRRGRQRRNVRAVGFRPMGEPPAFLLFAYLVPREMEEELGTYRSPPSPSIQMSVASARKQQSQYGLRYFFAAARAWSVWGWGRSIDGLVLSSGASPSDDPCPANLCKADTPLATWCRGGEERTHTRPWSCLPDRGSCRGR
jgi:hypothetical protein